MASNQEVEVMEEGATNEGSGEDNVFSDDDNIFEVDRVVGMMMHDGKMLFKVRWQNYGPEEDTWEPRDNLLSCEDLIEEYIEKQKAKKRRAKQTSQTRLNKKKSSDETESQTDASVSSQDSPEKKLDADVSESEVCSEVKVEVKTEESIKTEEKDDSEPDTLKDTFWRDLERGVLNFEGDMYSKVKGRRAALEAKKQQREKERQKKMENAKRASQRRQQKREDGSPKSKRKKKVKKKTPPSFDAFETLESATNRALDMNLHSPDASRNVSLFQSGFGSGSSGSYSAAEEVVTVAKLERFHSSSLISSTDDDEENDSFLGLSLKNDDKQTSFFDGSSCSSRPPGDAANERPEQTETSQSEEDTLLSRLSDASALREQRISKQLIKTEDDEMDTDSVFVKTDHSHVRDASTVNRERGVEESTARKEIVLPSKVSSIKEERLISGYEGTKASEKQAESSLQPAEYTSIDKSRSGDTDQQRNDKGSDGKAKSEKSERKLKSALKKTSAYGRRSEGFDLRADTNQNKDNGVKSSLASNDSDIDSGSLMEFDLDEYDPNDNIEPELDLPNEVTQEMFRQAVKDGNYVLVKHALNSKRQYNTNETDSSGLTLVMTACTGQHDEVLKLMVTNGGSVNSKQKNGTTALMIASENGYTSTVAILLEAGAHVNQQQSTGETALMKACKKGHKVIVRLLLENGSDPSIVSTHGNTAHQYAKLYNQLPVTDVLSAHNSRINKAVEGTVLRYLAGCARILKPLFPTRIFPICESMDQTVTFSIKSPQILQQQGVGTLLFLIHCGFYGQNINCKLTGPCCIKEVLLNNMPQQQVVHGSNFVISLCTKPNLNLLHIKTVQTLHSTCKLLVCGYILQLTSQSS